MDPLKLATTWAKDEIFSSQFFIFFGVMFMVAAIGFWQFGKTDTAKAFVIPMLIAGVLILTVGIGLFSSNRSRIGQLAKAYDNDVSAFVESEIARADKAMGEYKTIVFKVIPIIVVVAALLIVFIDKPIWRASSTTTIAMMTVILLVDNNANARIEAYKRQLVLAVETKSSE